MENTKFCQSLLSFFEIKGKATLNLIVTPIIRADSPTLENSEFVHTPNYTNPKGDSGNY